jgi:putative membrane protein
MANPEEAERDPRVYFAAERTFLAWIRTGLGLMGVGFAVARFGLFLRQMQGGESQLPVHFTGVSVWSGVALVALGVIVNLSAVSSHIAVVHKLKSGTWIPGRVSKSAVTLAMVLALVGIGMALYILFVH